MTFVMHFRQLIEKKEQTDGANKRQFENIFRAPMLTVKFYQPSHEFTFGVGMNFISYPLVLTPLV
jgi:hypothetical protein